MLADLQDHCVRREMSLQVRRLGHTIGEWFERICDYHVVKVSNGPTEALNNLIKRIKRTGFGLRNFENYRIRGIALRGDAELESAGLDRRPVTTGLPADIR